MVMKKFKYLILSLLSLFININAKNLTDYVDPSIGTDGHGHVFYGANVPFGMVQLGPVNINKGWDWCSGYHYSDSLVIGFSHTHLSGTGCPDLGDIMLMPFYGNIRVERGEQNDISRSPAAYYRKQNEVCEPGLYRVILDNDIEVSLTASERTGFHEYVFPNVGKDNYVMINLKEGIGDVSTETYIKKIDDYTIEGYRFSQGWSPGHKIYFTLKTQEPILELKTFEDNTSVGTDALKGKSVKGVIVFKESVKKIKLKVGISAVSCENALMNLQKEMPKWNFSVYRKQAENKWNKALSSIEFDSFDSSVKNVFYTSLYHSFFTPALFCDVNGDYRGHDDKIYKDASHVNYSLFSLWDTYRSLHPLLTITMPDRVDDMINSLIGIYEQQKGRLPSWALYGSETYGIGYSAVPVIADAYNKGFSGFDADKALNAMVHNATNPSQEGVNDVMRFGYISRQSLAESVSKGLEYSVDDWGIALMAKRMGKKDIYDIFKERATYYKNYFDKEMKFMRPRNNDGTWKTPFDPIRPNEGTRDYTEGNGWQYTFMVPQHPEGLVELMGGDKIFNAKLDTLFSLNEDLGKHAAIDITGLIGQYAHGNEPSHHVAYMYAYSGEQWKTANLIRYITTHFYTDKPDGLIGNEDCGQMSAWYVLSAMGLYQVNPSNGVFVFGSPLATHVELKMKNGKKFVINVENNSDENKYIQSVEFNGKPYYNSYITYDDIMNGGTLVFTMGKEPNKNFGTLKSNRPTSLN